MVERKEQDMQGFVEVGEALSYGTVELAAELRRIKTIVQTIYNGKALPETQKLLKKIADAEHALGAATEEFDTLFLQLQKIPLRDKRER